MQVFQHVESSVKPGKNCQELFREAAARVAWSPGQDVVLVARASCAGSSLEPVYLEVTALAQRLGAVEEVAA